MKCLEIEIVQPTFFDLFVCTGPACTDNCCHTWAISLDKAHYLRYKGEKDAAFRELCSKRIQRCKKDATPENYAVLTLSEDGRCGFQDPDGGCCIYRLLGPDALCQTCTLYPRRKGQFLPGVWELSLSLSCGEAARLALFSQDRMQFKRYCRPVCAQDILDQLPPLGIGRNGAPATPPPYGVALRQACMTLIWHRRYPLQERILAVGLLLRRIDRLVATGREEHIIASIEQFLESVDKGEFVGFFERLEYSEEAHLVALQLPAVHLLAGARKPVLQHLWSLLEPWCDCTDGEYRAGKRALEFLLHEMRERGDPLLQANITAVENYFTSYLFSSFFPFLYYNKGLTLEQNGIILAEQFVLLRLLLAFSHTGTDEEQMIGAVVSLSRLCQHSDLGQDIRKLLDTVKLDGLAHAAYFLR